MSGLEDAVARLAGVRSVTWQPRTRGLLVLYDPGAVEPAALVDAVAEHADVDVADEPSASDRYPPLTALLARPVATLNQRLHHASRGRADLRGLAPVLLVAWAAAELLRGRGTALSWSSALWYAHGLFRDYSIGSSE
jgi:hypothetical protein